MTKFIVCAHRKSLCSNDFYPLYKYGTATTRSLFTFKLNSYMEQAGEYSLFSHRWSRMVLFNKVLIAMFKFKFIICMLGTCV